MTRRRSDAGFSLAVLIFFATAASILLTAAIPAYQMQARREREEELIFRGEEYMRGIQKYQKRFGIYPPSLEALQQTNGLRFIRHLYTDPTSDKPFRLIYLNPDGSLSGSTVYSQRVVNTPALGSAVVPLASTPLASGATTTPPRSGAPPASTTPPRGGGTTGGAIPPPGANQTFGTSGIIGVASDTEQTSIKVYNGREKYNEWEFIAILGQPGVGAPGLPLPTTPPPVPPPGGLAPLKSPPLK